MLPYPKRAKEGMELKRSFVMSHKLIVTSPLSFTVLLIIRSPTNELSCTFLFANIIKKNGFFFIFCFFIFVSFLQVILFMFILPLSTIVRVRLMNSSKVFC